MRKGFLSFAIGAIALLSLVLSGTVLSAEQHPDSHISFRTLSIQELSIKRAFYDSVPLAVLLGLAESAATGADPYDTVRGSLLIQSTAMETELRLAGYDVRFWCGPIGEWQRQAAAELSASARSAAIPAGAAPIEACINSFHPDFGSLATVKEGEESSVSVSFSDIGFTYYSQSTGLAKVSYFPSGYGVSVGVLKTDSGYFPVEK